MIHRSNKLGYASAIIEGFHTALKGDYSWIITLDADLSHDTSAIPLLLRPAANHDLVLGSRHISGVRVVDWEMSRVLLSWMANRYARLVIGLPFHDLTTGFRCYSRSTLESIDFDHIKANGVLNRLYCPMYGSGDFRTAASITLPLPLQAKGNPLFVY